MTIGYYFKNFIWGGLFVIFSLYNLVRYPERSHAMEILIFSCFSSILFPFAKIAIEKTALTFTKAEFWYKGFFQDGVGKNGILACYYLFCFAISIPIGFLYLIYLLARRVM